MKNLIHRRFGKWKVLKYSRHNGHHNLWLCKCNCGIIKEVSSSNLLSGGSRQCNTCGHQEGFKGRHHTEKSKEKIRQSKILQKRYKLRRKNTQGYIEIYSSYHPYKNDKNRVAEHRLVMEKKIGRYLTKEEVVHHINGIRDDNRIENLMLFPNSRAHQKFKHLGKKTFICKFCKKLNGETV